MSSLSACRRFGCPLLCSCIMLVATASTLLLLVLPATTNGDESAATAGGAESDVLDVDCAQLNQTGTACSSDAVVARAPPSLDDDDDDDDVFGGEQQQQQNIREKRSSRKGKGKKVVDTTPKYQCPDFETLQFKLKHHEGIVRGGHATLTIFTFSGGACGGYYNVTLDYSDRPSARFCGTITGVCQS